jgi:hypothetical protein
LDASDFDISTVPVLQLVAEVQKRFVCSIIVAGSVKGEAIIFRQADPMQAVGLAQFMTSALSDANKIRALKNGDL